MSIENNTRTGLFLGAGASYEAGMPLVWELTKELKDWLTPNKFRELNSEWHQQAGGVPDVVEDDFCLILERDDIHYESILGYLETQRDRQSPMAQHYHHLYGWLIQMVYFILYFRHVNNRDLIRRSLDSYQILSTLVDENDTLWVFSLNHDLLVESVADHFQIPLFSGFGPTTMDFPCIDQTGQTNGHLVGEYLSGCDLDAGRLNYPNPLERGIYLLKIHGALDQFAINDGKDFARLCGSDRNSDDAIDILKRANEELNYFHEDDVTQRINVINEIVYTDKHGTAQFMRRSLLSGAHKFNDSSSQVVPKSMLLAFERNIGYITNLICIGYGFGDQHINLVLKRWLERSSKHTIEVVAPGTSGVPDFLLHVAPQVTVIPSGAFDFFDSRTGITPSRKEKLERQIGSKMRGLGREEAAAVVKAVTDDFSDSSMNQFVQKIIELPRKDGQPDFSGVDLEEFARDCFKPLQLSQEEILESFIEHLEGNSLTNAEKTDEH